MLKEDKETIIAAAFLLHEYCYSLGMDCDNCVLRPEFENCFSCILEGEESEDYFLSLEVRRLDND